MASGRRHQIHAGQGTESEQREWPIERLRGNDRWLLLATVGGQAQVRSAGYSTTLHVGDVLIWPPNTPQWYRRDPAVAEWEQRWVVFPDWHWWPGLGETWPEQLGQAWLQRSSPACNAKRVHSILDDVVATVLRADDPQQALAVNRLGELFLRIRLAQQRQASPDPQVADACRLLQADLAYDWSVPELAQRVGLSTSRLAHRFRDVTGVAPMVWRDRERMRYAAELLQLQQLPVKVVAGQVGYRDPLYFSRAFKRIMGVSPSRIGQSPARVRQADD